MILTLKCRFIIIFPSDLLFRKFSSLNCTQICTHIGGLLFRSLSFLHSLLIGKHCLAVVFFFLFLLGLTFFLDLGLLDLWHQLRHFLISYFYSSSESDELRLIDFITLVVLYIISTVTVPTYAPECLKTSSPIWEGAADDHAYSRGIVRSSIVKTTNTILLIYEKNWVASILAHIHGTKLGLRSVCCDSSHLVFVRKDII